MSNRPGLGPFLGSQDAGEKSAFIIHGIQLLTATFAQTAGVVCFSWRSRSASAARSLYGKVLLHSMPYTLYRTAQTYKFYMARSCPISLICEANCSYEHCVLYRTGTKTRSGGGGGLHTCGHLMTHRCVMATATG